MLLFNSKKSEQRWFTESYNDKKRIIVLEGDNVESFPCLINNEKVPDCVLGDCICHLKFSFVPLSKTPSEFSDPELFIITPSERVSNMKASVLVPPTKL